MYLSNENNPLLLKETAAQILLPIGDFHCQNRCELVCKLWHDLFKACSHYQVAKENHFAAKIWPAIVHFPSSLIEALGGKKKIVQLPDITKQSLKPHSSLYLDFAYISLNVPKNCNHFDMKELDNHAICRFEHDGRPGIAARYTLIQSDFFHSGIVLLHQTWENKWERHGDLMSGWLKRATEEDLAWFLSGEKHLLVDEQDHLLHLQLGTQEMPLKHKVNAIIQNTSRQALTAVGIFTTALEILSVNVKSSIERLGS